MRMRRIIPWILAVFLAAAAAPAQAAGVDVEGAQADALELDKLETAAEQYTGGAVGLDTGLDNGLRILLDNGSQQMTGILSGAVRSGVLLLTVVLLCGVAEGIVQGKEKGGMDAVAVAGSLAVTALAVTDVNSLIGIGKKAIEDMDFFSKVLLPVVTAAAAAGGSPGGATARQLATVLFSNVLVGLIDGLLLPMTYVYIVACTAYAALGNEGLKRIGAAVKWVVTASLTTLVLIFVAYLTVSGAVAGSTDAAAVKAAKMAVSGAVPVVGGILSDAAETILAGAGIIKNTVGVFGMLVVLAMCVTPFLQLGIHYLVYKGVSAVTATVSQGRVAALIDSIGGAFGLVLGMTGSCALLLLVAITSALCVAGG